MIVYREADNELGQYEDVEWAELPRDAVVRALLDAVIATGRFADAGLATNMTKPNLILTGQLRKFDLDRTAKPWTAVCEVRLELRETFGPALLYGETITATQPLDENEVSALPPAMSAAVAQAIQRAATEIAEEVTARHFSRGLTVTQMYPFGKRVCISIAGLRVLEH